MRSTFFALGLGLFSVVGCSDDSAADRLLFNLDTGGGAVQVDTVCGTFCGGGDQIAVGIGYPTGESRSDDVIELRQYRVDYDLPYVSRMPYFAGTVSLALGPGDNASTVVTVAGTAQREHVYDAVGSDPVAGTATLTFAGYDWDGEAFTVETEFDIRFAELPDGFSSQVEAEDPGASDEPVDAGTGEGGGDAAAE